MSAPETVITILPPFADVVVMVIRDYGVSLPEHR
jgi:hypothetical protein